MTEDEHRLVTAINRVFYDVEAENYDQRHMEVVVGDAEWWERAAATYIGDERPSAPIVVLDVGCGTGFVGDQVQDHLEDGDVFIGYDLSPVMLEQSRHKLARRRRGHMGLVNGEAHQLPFADASIDILTMNAFLHHLGNYAAAIVEADRVLKPGGHILINHEPNRTFFGSPVIRWLASFYKLIGCGIDLSDEIEAEVNRELRRRGITDAPLEKTEIQRLVEFHSPVEQSRVAVSREKGFDPETMAAENFRGYAVIEVEEFTTFFVRPVFERHPWLGSLIRRTWTLLTRRGNLFRMVLRKV